ncbi:hypothetical protein FQN55_004492 [Onygenales sp. PD_40]|nr:hypothetical protein FQN55_004492 [Onygenales sp. PD_40]
MHLNFVTVFSLLAAAGQGYILDDSCTKDANALNFMTVNLGWTFESARIARDALARRPWNKEEDGPLMDLATWIFKEDGSEPQVPRPLYETKEVLLNNAHDPRRNLDKLRDVLTNVLDLDGKTIRRKQPQVEFFCDLSRYGEPDTVRGRVFDRVRRIFFYLTDNPSYDCSKPFVMAYSTLGIDDDEPDLVQICPGYFKKMMDARVTSTAPFKKLHSTGLAVSPVPSTAMDIASLFDNTVLHELFHTKWAGDMDDIGLLFDPYGWKNIVKMDKEISINNAGQLGRLLRSRSENDPESGLYTKQERQYI